MSNLARKMQYQNEQVQQVAVKQKKLPKFLITPGEMVIGAAFIALVCFGASKIIDNESTLYKMNQQIQDTKSTIALQEKTNKELEMRVSDLSNYERIRKVADKRGLNLENNVKVVE